MVTTKIGETASAGDANVHQLIVSDLTENEKIQHYIKVLTGSIKIQKREITGSAYAYPAGEKVIITEYNGGIYIQQTNGADTFVVSA